MFWGCSGDVLHMFWACSGMIWPCSGCDLCVTGGKIIVCSAYAPHSGKSFADRRRFYSNLGTFLASESRHGPALVLGDFNARLHHRFPGEENIMGPHVFGDPGAAYNPASNRSLLAELCVKQTLVIGNTLFDKPPEKQITCYNVGKRACDFPTPDNFGQIDFALISQEPRFPPV